MKTWNYVPVSYNYKIKALKPLFDKHPNVHRSNENPTVYAWVNRDDQIQSDKREKQRTYNKYIEESSDVTDVTETEKKKDEIKNTNSANVTCTIVTTTSPTTQLDIDYSSDTTATNDKEQENLTSDASDASDDSSVIITDNKSIEKIVLKHSTAAHVLTNDDLEDIDNSSNESRGESV
jgi:hypothetical protein